MPRDVGSKKKVYIGMSGGVDSSVSAALLKDAGFNVTGVFIKVWQPDWINCTWREDRLDAMRVAAKLDIDFITLDLEDVYKKEVIDYMVNEYKAGNVPNPDVMCNQHVKFGAFYDWAMDNGADYVATGHYARVVDNNILMGVDREKDQTYFLWAIRNEQIPKILFPIGGYRKPEVRELGRKYKLPNADKKDSQGLCFVGKIDFKEFLSHYVDSKPGKVLNETGEVIGNHPGSIFFTLGERHGFSINENTPNQTPYYVIDKDVSLNTITVSTDKTKLFVRSDVGIKIGSVNWMDGHTPEINKVYKARSRYRGDLYDIKIKSVDGDKALIEPQSKDMTSVSGQSLVIYDGEKCLGGGIIEK